MMVTSDFPLSPYIAEEPVKIFSKNRVMFTGIETDTELNKPFHIKN
jgi:hypothetical protein